MEMMSALRKASQVCISATALVAAAAALRILPLQIMDARLAWLTFYPVVVLAAVYGGLPAGLLAVSLSCLSVAFVLPRLTAQLFIRDAGDWFGLLVFVVTGVLISGVVEALHRARIIRNAAGTPGGRSAL